ncbi:MAG: VOC family protein [Dehalococcoidia bacterium]|nr:VOC family protein [Dehalococcoidia bacterium]
MPEIQGLTEVVIWVHNMEESLHFYRDLLGLRVMSPPDFRGAVFLQAGQSQVGVPQQIVLVPLPQGAPAFPGERAQRPLHHIGIELAPEDFETESDRLQSLGFDVRFGEHPFLAVKGMYVDDPDGNEVELIASTSQEV